MQELHSCENTIMKRGKLYSVTIPSWFAKTSFCELRTFDLSPAELDNYWFWTTFVQLPVKSRYVVLCLGEPLKLNWSTEGKAGNAPWRHAATPVFMPEFQMTVGLFIAPSTVCAPLLS